MLLRVLFTTQHTKHTNFIIHCQRLSLQNDSWSTKTWQKHHHHDCSEGRVIVKIFTSPVGSMWRGQVTVTPYSDNPRSICPLRSTPVQYGALQPASMGHYNHSIWDATTQYGALQAASMGFYHSLWDTTTQYGAPQPACMGSYHQYHILHNTHASFEMPPVSHPFPLAYK